MWDEQMAKCGMHQTNCRTLGFGKSFSIVTRVYFWGWQKENVL
jgi:hypothetical protein